MRFLRQPAKPISARPVLNSGKAAGRETTVTTFKTDIVEIGIARDMAFGLPPESEILKGEPDRAHGFADRIGISN